MEAGRLGHAPTIAISSKRHTEEPGGRKQEFDLVYPLETFTAPEPESWDTWGWPRPHKSFYRAGKQSLRVGKPQFSCNVAGTLSLLWSYCQLDTILSHLGKENNQSDTWAYL